MIFHLPCVTEYSDPTENPGTGPDFTEKMGPHISETSIFTEMLFPKLTFFTFIYLKNRDIIFK